MKHKKLKPKATYAVNHSAYDMKRIEKMSEDELRPLLLKEVSKMYPNEQFIKELLKSEQSTASLFEKDEEGIIKFKKQQIQLAESLLENKASAFDVSYLLSFMNLIIYRRAIRLAQNKVNKLNIIQKIPDFCVIVMGSGGRMESYLHPDQDNGIIYDLKNSKENPSEVDKYFFELAKEFTRILDAADIP
ncbi:MAG: DUF294 nucleotidyltransferase-like domain-containing protein, partial [Candidatus Kapaibacteriota bacterium]